MSHVKSGLDELQELLHSSARELDQGMKNLLLELASPVVDVHKMEYRRRKLAEVISRKQAVADMIGRKRFLMEADARARSYGLKPALAFAATIPDIVPNVEFVEAVGDIVRREPRLAETAAKVSDLYSTERAFAAVRSAEFSLTERLRKFVAEALKTGKTLPEAETVIQELSGWTRAYSETVFRTNVATAYASGRFQQATDPDLDDFVIGLRRVSVMDADTRENHRAAHGIVAKTSDPIWEKLGVPAGYNCRCSFELVDRIQAKRNGWLTNSQLPLARTPAGAYNDPGFQNRAISDVYGRFQ